MYQRRRIDVQRENILLIMASHWTGAGWGGSCTDYVVIRSDGTFTVSLGARRGRRADLRRHNFMHSIIYTEEVALSEYDFKRIAELVKIIIESPSPQLLEPHPYIGSRYHVFLLDGELYKGIWEFTDSYAFDDLISQLRRLSPLYLR